MPAASQTTGKSSDLPACHRTELDQSENLAHLIVALPAVRHLLQDCDVVDELEDREVAIEPGLLGHVPQSATDLNPIFRPARVASSSAIDPVSGASTVASIRSIVVFPAPLGPSSPVMPRSTTRSILSSA